MSDDSRRSSDNGLEKQIMDLRLKVAHLEEKLISADHALDLARESLVRWQETSNEWRQENVDQRAQYLTIDKGNSLISTETVFRYALEARVRLLEQKATEESGKGQGSHSVWALILAVVTIVISLGVFFMRFSK